MTTSAILMLVVAVVVVWGGLALAIALMMRSKRPGDPSFHRDL